MLSYTLKEASLHLQLLHPKISILIKDIVFAVPISPSAVQQALTIAAAAHTLLNTSQQSVNPIGGASSSSLNSGMASSPGSFAFVAVASSRSF